MAVGFVLASPFVAVALQRWSLLGTGGPTVSLDRWLVLPLATTSLSVGLIHGAVAGDHFTEGLLTGLFFVFMSAFQIVWAIVFVRHPEIRLAAVGCLVNASVIALWLLTRTVGLPFGAHLGIPEPAGTPDLLATAMESVIVAGTAVLVLPALRRTARQARFAVASADLTVVMALIVIAMVTSYAMADISLNGGHVSMAGSPSGVH